MDSRVISSRESLFLDSVKALMLIEVVLGHAVALSIPRFSDLDFSTPSGLVLGVIRLATGFGRECAFLFVFFSGFFCAKEMFPREHFFRFSMAIKWRIARLYPVFLFSLIATGLIDYLGAHFFGFFVYEDNGLQYKLSSHWDPIVFAANVISLQPTFSITFGTNGPLWTLGYLIQFFVAASVIRFVVGNNISRFLVMSLIVALGFVPISGWEPSLLFVVWCLGMCSWWGSPVFFQQVRLRWILPLTIGLFFVARVSPLYLSVCLTPLIGCGLLELCKRISYDLPISIMTWVRGLSFINYAAYAIHMPILFFVAGVYGLDSRVGSDNSICVVFSYLIVILLSVYFFATFIQRTVRRFVSV